jgi:hypothetical protein
MVGNKKGKDLKENGKKMVVSDSVSKGSLKKREKVLKGGENVKVDNDVQQGGATLKKDDFDKIFNHSFNRNLFKIEKQTVLDEYKNLVIESVNNLVKESLAKNGKREIFPIEVKLKTLSDPVTEVLNHDHCNGKFYSSFEKSIGLKKHQKEFTKNPESKLDLLQKEKLLKKVESLKAQYTDGTMNLPPNFHFNPYKFLTKDVERTSDRITRLCKKVNLPHKELDVLVDTMRESVDGDS